MIKTVKSRTEKDDIFIKECVSKITQGKNLSKEKKEKFSSLLMQEILTAKKENDLEKEAALWKIQKLLYKED